MALFSPLIEQAAELALQWHDRTYRKSRWREEPFEVPPEELLRVPVGAHLAAVALTVQRAGFDDETIAAAFLHDALEDLNHFGATLTPARLTELVGPGVTALVLEVTEPKVDAAGVPRPWRERKEAYLRQLSEGTVRGAAISLADKLHNLWSLSEAIERGVDVFRSTPTRRGLSAGPAAQLWFHDAVLTATRRHEDPRLEPLRDEAAAQLARFERLVAGAAPREGA